VRPNIQYYNSSDAVGTRVEEWCLNSRRDCRLPQNVQPCSGAQIIFNYVGTLALPVVEGSKTEREVMLTTYVHLLQMLCAATSVHPYNP